MNTSQLQQLAGLQLKLSNIVLNISSMERLARELANDECQASIHIAVHNQTVCDRNKQELKEAQPTSPDIEQLASQIIGRDALSKKQPLCGHQLKQVLTEASALRVLNVLLLELKEREAEVKAEMSRLLTILQTEKPICHEHI